MNQSLFSPAFWQHVEALRSCLCKSVIAFLLACLLCFNFMGQLLPLIVAPAGHLVFTSPSDAFGAHLTLALIVGGILSSPYILFEVWRFVSLALTEKERKFIYVFGPLSLVFFLGGVAFAFWVAVPVSYQFLMGFSSSYLMPMITVNSYMEFVGNLVLAFGVTFELPLVLAFLAKIGIATPAYLVQKRRHAIIIILIISAILTPPDVISQLLLGIPLWLLYEVGIIFVKLSHKSQRV